MSATTVIKELFALLMVALAVYIVVTTWLQWRLLESMTNKWQRILATARNSATILWTKITVLMAAGVANADQVFDAVGLPQVAQFVNTWFTPKTVAAVMAGIALVTFFARTRRMSKDPV